MLYGNRCDVLALPPVTPYRDYLAWIATRNHESDAAAWGAALTGLEEPTLVVPHDPGRSLVLPEKMMLAVSEKLSDALTRQASRAG